MKKNFETVENLALSNNVGVNKDCRESERIFNSSAIICGKRVCTIPIELLNVDYEMYCNSEISSFRSTVLY